MQSIEGLISPRAVDSMREEIIRAGGSEVFFVGELLEGEGVHSVRVAARGNHASAPAIMKAASPGEVVIHNHPSGELTPSDADLAVASALGNSGVGFYIVDNGVTSAYVVVETFAEQEIEPLNQGELVSLLEPGGLISKKLRGYEYRPQQGDMMEAVARAFNREGISLVEAGTGTGKTMAYLLPAIRWAESNGERVVISTHTINLQEQLMHKDIPFLQRSLGRKFKAVLVMGRGNYACLRKAGHLEAEPGLFVDPEELSALSSLLKWVKKTTTGYRAELGFIPPAALWEKLCSESDYCMGHRCPDQKRCFVNAARRQAAAADLLVVNHHLLFADMALRKLTGALTDLSILPRYKRLIIDEAHTVEDVATSYFGTRITRMGLARMLGRLYRARGGGRGQLPYLAALLNSLQGDIGGSERFKETVEESLIPAVSELVTFSGNVFDAIFEQMARLLGRGYPELKLRLTPPVVNSGEWKGLLEGEVSELAARLKTLAGKLTDTSGKMARTGEEALTDQCFELRVAADRLEALAADLQRVLWGGRRDEVAWVEGRAGERGAGLVRALSSPLDMSGELVENLFIPVPTVVLTSATLTVENRFDYLKSRLGLDSLEDDRVEELLLPSPFDYKTQAIVGIPTDIPHPGEERFDELLGDLIHRSLEVTGGKALILFTSYKSLDRVHEELREPLTGMGITALRQGERPRHQLLEAFRRDKTSVLFATDSFWQGVDVEGEALECVIMVKLPFRVPTEPVLEARCQYIEAQGGNPFLEYIVPQAIIKLKQGMGRLIRKRTDRGAVLILDRRIVDKSYGKLFMNSLPPCKVVARTMEEVLGAVGEFHANVK
jgi:ATP-dependent DNA helicase DinG